MFPSPHSGILFLFGLSESNTKRYEDVSVPSFGDSFFIKVGETALMRTGYVSVPSFGDSFFIREVFGTQEKFAVSVSVPSFGDSFFINRDADRIQYHFYLFPSPHSGILFLSIVKGKAKVVESTIVSVPSFGDSFFMNGFPLW